MCTDTAKANVYLKLKHINFKKRSFLFSFIIVDVNSKMNWNFF